MSYLQDQIAVEKQRIAVFESKIDQCKKRIASLEYLLQDSSDELDTLASNTVPTNISAAMQGSVTLTADAYVRTKPIADKQLRLLKFIGKEGKKLKEMIEFSNLNNLDMTPENIRNFVVVYKKRYGLIESPHSGFYQLTKTGINAIE